MFHMNGLFWIIGWRFWVFPLLIICTVYLLVRNNSQARYNHNEENPLDILKKRYARGELTRDQYEQMRNDLLK